MNKKIKTLYNKALESYTYSDIDGDSNKGTQLDAEKFAELIIQECIDMIELRANTCADVLDSKKANEYVKESQRECARMIKNHFGIEQ